MNKKKEAGGRAGDKGPRARDTTYNNFDDILVLKSPVHLCFFHGILYTFAAKGTSDLLESIKSTSRHVLNKVHEAEPTEGRNGIEPGCMKERKESGLEGQCLASKGFAS